MKMVILTSSKSLLVQILKMQLQIQIPLQLSNQIKAQNGSTSDNKAPVDTPKEKNGKSETVKGNEILKKAPLANGTTPVAKSGSFTKYWRLIKSWSQLIWFRTRCDWQWLYVVKKKCKQFF